MKQGSKLGLEPKLRFPEFHDEPAWEEKGLYEISKPVSDKATESDVKRILTLSSEYGIVLQSDYFDKRIAGKNVDRYTKINFNDFVYNDRATKSSAYGTIKRLSQNESGIVSPIYKSFRFDEEENPIFWEWYFESGFHEAQLHDLVNEGARTGRFNISIDSFLSISVWCPNPSEQQKIADCLSSLDELITFQNRKLDTLNAHKKGLLQQLFPAEGETLPKLRFPEFRDAPEWEESKLSDFASFVSERASDREFTLMSVTAGVGLVTQVEKFGKEIAGNSYRNYFVIREGDFAYNKSATRDYPEGFISMLEGRDSAAVPNSIFLCFRIEADDINRQLLKHMFFANYHGQWLRRLITIGARAHGALNVNPDDLMRMPIRLPVPEEQERIADCLSFLDDLIAAQAQKLDTLNAHRKGLMQQLFPSPEEV